MKGWGYDLGKSLYMLILISFGFYFGIILSVVYSICGSERVVVKDDTGYPMVRVSGS